MPSRPSRSIIASVLLASVLALGFDLAADATLEPSTRTVELDPGTRLRTQPQASPRAPGSAAGPGHHGGVLFADADGLLVAERSAGVVVRVDAQGKPVASLALTPELGELVSDGAGQAFVADRRGDQVVVFDPRSLTERARASVSEPHGLALTPDGKTLLVTSVAEHELVALDAETLESRWTLELAPEPRAVAVSADGRQAAVGFLSSSSLAVVDLSSRSVRWQTLEPRDHVEIDDDDEFVPSRLVEARSRFQVPVETGRRYARNVFALAWVGGRLAAPHQLATPQLRRVPTRERSDTYGGSGGEAVQPMVHRVALLGEPGSIAAEARFVELDLHQPRALAYDPRHDVLYVGGYGDDRLVALADATQQMPYVDWFADLGHACGLDGLALAPSEDDATRVWAHCEFTRQVVRLDVGDPSTTEDDTWLQSPALAESTRDPLVERGAALFRESTPKLSDDGILSCSSCHPEGRSDGLTWRLGSSILQVPVLAGRVAATGPYKWDGQDPDLHASIRHTAMRLGSRTGPDDAQVDALVAYLEQLPPPKPKTPDDPEAVARGRALFVAEACSACHVGDLLTDKSQHVLDTTLEQVDTPSLVALGHSAPYYHDGSASDLRTLLTDRGTIHEMAETAHLSDAQVADLTAYLESL